MNCARLLCKENPKISIPKMLLIPTMSMPKISCTPSLLQPCAINHPILAQKSSASPFSLSVLANWLHVLSWCMCWLNNMRNPLWPIRSKHWRIKNLLLLSSVYWNYQRQLLWSGCSCFMLCSMPSWMHWQKYWDLVIVHSTWLGGIPATWLPTGDSGTDPCTSSLSATFIFLLFNVECHQLFVNYSSFWSLLCCMKCWWVFQHIPSLDSHSGACWARYLWLHSHMASRNGEAKAPRLVIPSFGECCMICLLFLSHTFCCL